MSETTSQVLGAISIVCWCIVYAPQLYKNYKTPHASLAISKAFLITWLAGDAFYLVASVIKWWKFHEMTLSMVGVGISYAIADSLLIAQTVYYTKQNRALIGIAAFEAQIEQQKLVEQNGIHNMTHDVAPEASSTVAQEYELVHDIQENDNVRHNNHSSDIHHEPIDIPNSGSTHRPHHLRTTFHIAVCTLAVVSPFIEMESPVQPGILIHQPPNRSFHVNHLYIVSISFGWIASACFVAARLPQIYKNFASQSTEGLAPAMFIFSVLGNLTGLASFFTFPTTMYANLAMIIGSTLCLITDLIILGQTYWYKHKLSNRDVLV